MKIQSKITLLFSLLCTSVIIALSFGVSYFTYKNASQDFLTRLELRARIAARATLDTNEGTAAFNEIRKEHLQRLPKEREFIINIDTLERARNTGIFKEIPESFLSEILSNNDAGYRKDFDFFQGIVYSTATKKFIVIVSAQNSLMKEFVESLNKILITACIISIMIVVSVGLIFSRQILAPVRNISRQVQRITATSLHLRLNVSDGKDEISDLNTTFNDMLDRLETAFESQNNFVSNASHELNTPLTAVIGEADFALAKRRTDEEYKQSLTVILQQGEKLKEITESLVQLARAGFTENLTMSPVNLRELVHNSKQNAQHVYSACNIQVFTQTDDEVLVKGNQQLLELAVSNVLLNACKYSNNKPVTVTLNKTAQEAIITIKDQGIGIPAAELKNIFDPFFRASNVQNVDGYGIGLPLTRNIIRLHKGSILINSNESQGTEVIISLKTA